MFSAYAFAFLRFPFKKVFFLAVLGALMVPGHVTLLINYITIGNLGLINSYAGIFLPGLASAFGTFLLRQHFLSMTREVLEAAELDGCGHFRRLTRFVLPMAKPAVVTVALIAVIDEWNDFIWPLIVLTDERRYTLPVALASLVGEHVLDTELMMAGSVLTVMPVLLLFLGLQKQYIEGITLGGVKE